MRTSSPGPRINQPGDEGANGLADGGYVPQAPPQVEQIDGLGVDGDLLGHRPPCDEIADLLARYHRQLVWTSTLYLLATMSR